MYVVVIGAKINSAKARSSATFGYFSCFSLPLHAIAHRPKKKPELSSSECSEEEVGRKAAMFLLFFFYISTHSATLAWHSAILREK